MAEKSMAGPSLAKLNPTKSKSLISEDIQHEYVDGNIRDLQLNDRRINTKVEFDNADSLEVNHPPQERDCLQNIIDKHQYKKHRNNYFKAAKKASKYYRKVMMLYDAVYEEIKFPVMPEKLDAINHLSAIIWLVTYSIQEYSDDIDEPSDAERISESYAKVVYEAMQVEEFLRNFTKPLSTLTEIGYDLINHMRRSMMIPLINEDITTFQSQVRPSITGTGNAAGDNKPKQDTGEIEPDNISIGTKYYTLSDDARGPPGHAIPTVNLSKIVKGSLLVGSRILEQELFDRLEIYMRTTARRKWFLLQNRTKESKIKLVQESASEVSSSLSTLGKLLKPVLKILKKGEKAWCCQPTILKHFSKMAKSLQAISYQYSDLLGDDENLIIKEIFQSEDRLFKVVNDGKEIVQEILEILAMSQMCYVYLADGLKIPIKSCEGTLKALYNYKGKPLFRSNDFQANDFFKTKYPDVLRKLPVIVNRNELSLHKCTDRSMFAILGMSGKSSSRATRRISKQPVKRASQEERERKLRNINNEEFSRSRFKFNTI